MSSSLHRTDSFLLTENVKVEIVHGSYPYTTGAPISLIVKFKHLGSRTELVSLKEKLRQLHQDTLDILQKRAENDPMQQDPSWMSSLVKTLKNINVKASDQDTELIQQNNKLQSVLSKQLQFHKPLTLMSGYVQTLGFLMYDPEMLDQTKLHSGNNALLFAATPHHQKTSSIGNRASAPSPLEKNIDDEDEDIDTRAKYDFDLFKYYNPDPEYTSDSLNKEDTVPLSQLNKSPLLLIPQTLLFSELHLEPGDTKTYQFKSPMLPLDIPPSNITSGRNLIIDYFIELGLDKLSAHGIDRHDIRVPISLIPHINNKGEQCMAVVDRAPIIMEPGVIKEVSTIVTASKPDLKVRKVSAASIDGTKRRASTQIPKKSVEEIHRLKESFVKIVNSAQKHSGAKDIDELVELQLNKQFGVQPVSNQADAEITTNKDSGSYTPQLIPQLAELQQTYQINRNGQFIAKLQFSKPYYTVTDNLEMTLHLDNSSQKISAIRASLEFYEIINPKYTPKNRDIQSKGNLIYEAHAVSFDGCEKIPFKMYLPKNSARQIAGQFKTDVFQLKWMLALKFVLAPILKEGTLEKFYEDKLGVLFHAKENLDGEEFTCHIPVPILASVPVK